MLQLILITTNTGVIKFKKSLITDLDRDIFLRLSNLIVTLFVKSKREVDHKLSYFELNNRGVTIEENTQSKLLCILMHDITDGYEFAKLVAEELLDRFIATFRTPSSIPSKTLYSNSFKNPNAASNNSSLNNNYSISSNGLPNNNAKATSPQTLNNTGMNLFGSNQKSQLSSFDGEDSSASIDTAQQFKGNSDFSSMDQMTIDDWMEQQEYDFNNINVDEKIFEAKLAEIYLELVYPIIEHLDGVRGILNSWLIESGDEGILTTTKPQLEADLKFLVNNCDRLLNGEMQNLTIKGNGKNLQVVTVEHKCHLVVLLESNVQPEITGFAIEKAVFLLRKVYALRKNIKIQ